jgi:hypothetical protein
MSIRIKTQFIDEEVALHFARYYNSSIAITGVSTNGSHEPIFKATVAIDGELPGDDCVFLKGWSENIGLPEALVKAGVVDLTGRKIRAGHCKAVEARLLI